MRPDPRPPRRICSRRPASSGATGRRGNPAQDGHTSRSAGCTPRLRSPFPSVSSSSSSFCLLRFPEVVPVTSSARGSAPGPASPNRSCGSSIKFKSVKIMFGLSSSSGAAHAASVRSVRRSFRHPPCPARLRPGSVQARSASGSRRPFFRSTNRSRPPVPLVCCSFRSWFAFQVCFVVQFSSVQFVLFRVGSIRWVQFVSCVFLSVQVSLISSGFELIFLCSPVGCACYLYYSRVYYTR